MGLLGQSAVAALVPGWNLAARHRRAGVALVLIGTVFPVLVLAYIVVSTRNWVAVTLDTRYLAWVMVAGVVAVATRLVAVAETWVALRAGPGLGGRDAAVLGIVVAICAPLVVGVVEVGQARASIAPVFSAPLGGPLFDASATTVPPPVTTSPPTTSSAATTAPPEPAATSSTSSTTSTTSTTLPARPARPRSGVDPALLADVTTVLLVGGDAGPGRSGLRTDTMMLFSLHRPSGRAALISIPRDLERLLFPPGSALEERFPYGFDDITNHVYPYVSSRRELRDAYDVPDVPPGIVALAHGLGYTLDVTIDDYVLVDMQGFLQLIDALGGVTVSVPKAVPMPGNVPGAPTQYPDVLGPGVIHMDGTTALGYVRSRKGDSDYHRTRRQRDLLAALATQISADDVIFAFGAVTSAVGATLRTSLSTDELAETLAVIGGQTAIVESVGLVPPLVNVRRPDHGQLARIVGEVRAALATGVPSGY